MTPDPNLLRHLRVLLGASFATPALGTGCREEVTECIHLDDPEAECPTQDEATDRLRGQETCSSPVVVVRRATSEAERYESGDTGWGGTQCCYEVVGRARQGQSCAYGRPLMYAHQPVVAPVRAAPSPWAEGRRPVVEGLDTATRAALAAQWTADAQAEHASVAAFARVALELMAHGAPPDLLLGVHAAAADEVRHATGAFALASAFAGTPVGPGPLSIPARAVPDLVTLAVETAREAAVGETLATLVAAERLRAATDPAVRAVLEQVVADEARHAALGWAVLRWAVAAGGEPVRVAVAEALSDLDGAIDAMAAFQPGDPPAAAADFGVLPRARIQRALHDAAPRVLPPVIAGLATVSETVGTFWRAQAGSRGFAGGRVHGNRTSLHFDVFSSCVESVTLTASESSGRDPWHLVRSSSIHARGRLRPSGPAVQPGISHASPPRRARPHPPPHRAGGGCVCSDWMLDAAPGGAPRAALGCGVRAVRPDGGPRGRSTGRRPARGQPEAPGGRRRARAGRDGAGRCRPGARALPAAAGGRARVRR
jgi:hypothetical protein